MGALVQWVPLLVQYKVIVLFIVRKVVNGVFSPAMLLEPVGDWVDDRVECSMDSQSAAAQLTTAPHMPCRVAAETACNLTHEAKLL